MSNAILPDPPPELKRLSEALSEKIRMEIQDEGFMSFARYMEMALYEPGLGYYSAGLPKFGESGDFITAPEIGSLFAQCLAQQVAEIAQSLGSYDILELGAGTGKLAADLLTNLAADRQPKRYLIFERSGDLRAVQQHVIAARVPNWQDRVKWLNQPPSEPWDGVLLANEVIDALAIERFRISEKGIEQVGVSFNEQGFQWRYRPAPDELKYAVRRLGLETQRQAGFSGFAGGTDDWESDYTSEISVYLESWLKSVVSGLRKGVALFIDYGYPRSEYYLPDRSDGTLICLYRHRAHSDVFFWPGLQDITAFIDFTALAEAAEGCALEVAAYTSQTMFLLGCGLDRILSQRIKQTEDSGVLLNSEARQLTMPGSMGERFQVMALTRDFDQAMKGFKLRDLRHRL
jgi:SAM-dependent MidA family methyltransferase